MSLLLIKNISALVQVEDNEAFSLPIKGAQLKHLPTIKNAWLLIDGERIKDFGKMETCPTNISQVIDNEGKMIFPTWCDSHTHLVFAASREQEFVYRIEGLSYAEIAQKGGGILNSARKLQATSEEKLLEDASQRLAEVIQYGTGAIEIKSGYGLTYESELKMLRVIRQLKEQSDASVDL